MTTSVHYKPPTPLNQACRSGHLSNALTSIKRGEKPDSQTLTYACDSKDVNVVKAMIRNGARPDSETLTRACLTKKLTIINAVLGVGARPDEDTLGIAIKTHQVAIVKKTLEAGAKPNEYDVQLAKKTGKKDIITLVENVLGATMLSSLSASIQDAPSTPIAMQSLDIQFDIFRSRLAELPASEEISSSSQGVDLPYASALRWLQDLLFVPSRDIQTLKRSLVRTPRMHPMPKELMDAIIAVKQLTRCESEPYYNSHDDSYITEHPDQRDWNLHREIKKAIIALQKNSS